MNLDRLKKALQDYKEGKVTESELLTWLKDLPFEDLGFARVDHHRSLRQGFPEVIYGRGKTDAQTLAIARSLLSRNPNLLITSAGRGVFEALQPDFADCNYHPECGAVTVCREPQERGRGPIGVFSAGTADLSVADEAAVTAGILGNQVIACHDVGVAGIHRLLHLRKALESCTVIVAVAGMEGALPSVIGGLVGVPVIAVPTSVGYGSSFGGVAALLGMLNSCAPNVSVVNIDNGFGGGYVASLINRKSHEEPSAG